MDTVRETVSFTAASEQGDEELVQQLVAMRRLEEYGLSLAERFKVMARCAETQARRQTACLIKL
ncbi:hypothetical protein [Trichlorobacter sp.]|uniref:hypothetical protein n=1 Tax=Trichlorobacter sp. TaxID=2911007 RepID=UPI002A35D9F7|nr:hypothetical protein [Trichlorobacter sp.]MDY0383600.1 hypothetical protein [Trichlorobacter sp.]